MGFNKHNWKDYRNRGNKGKRIDITILDETNKKLDFFSCRDNDGFNRVIKLLKIKYGFIIKNKNNNDYIKEEMKFLSKIKEMC